MWSLSQKWAYASKSKKFYAEVEKTSKIELK